MTAHFPGRPPIDAYGGGGFRFAGMSHRGSIIILPSGVYDWNPAEPLAVADFVPVFTEQSAIQFLLLGTGQQMRRPPAPVRQAFDARKLPLDFMSTGSAVRTWNILLAEGRRVACALLAVENAQ